MRDEEMREPKKEIDPFTGSLRQAVRMFYDLQRVRIQVAGRLQPKAKGGEIQLSEADLAQLRGRVEDLVRLEAAALRDVENLLLEGSSFYRAVLLADRKKWKGLAKTMAGVILSEIDIRRCVTVGTLYSFAGLAPLPAHRCRACHSVVSDELMHYKNQEGMHCPHALTQLAPEQVYESGKLERPVKGEKLAYNSGLRAKLLGVLGPNLLRAGSPYRKFYDDYKHRKVSAGWGKNDGHRHNAAVRYMVKMLLLDLWKAWREHEGLPVRPPYAEQYLGLKHHESRNLEEQPKNVSEPAYKRATDHDERAEPQQPTGESEPKKKGKTDTKKRAVYTKGNHRGEASQELRDAVAVALDTVVARIEDANDL